LKVPEAVGVPLMVMVLLAQVAETPAGKPFAPETPLLEIPDAPVVLCVIFVNKELIQSAGALEATPNVLIAFTVMVPVAFNEPQPPVNGML
jgi:hypothetical protein